MADQGKKLDRETIKRIRYLIGQGMSIRRVAALSQVAKSTVQRVKKLTLAS